MDVAIRSEAQLGECPRWDAAARQLLWVDIEAGFLHVSDPESGHDRAILLGSRVSAVTPTRSGRTLVALADRLAIVDLADESIRTLVEMPHGAGMRMNDGACDPAGRFWVGSTALDFAPGAGALYRYSPDGILERVLTDLTLSNGLGWAPDGRSMYFIDSMTYGVDVFDFDVSSGGLSRRRRFVTFDRADGIPDGLAVDHDGGVWVAFYGGGTVRRYEAGGTLDQVLVVPADNVTACCFGGDEGGSLYVTTASVELTAEQRRRQPLAGSVFVTGVGVTGPPAQPFAD